MLRKLEGATPSQRNEFRAKERFRLQQLEKQEKRREEEKREFNKKQRREAEEVVVKSLRRPQVNLSSFLGNSLLRAHVGRGLLSPSEKKGWIC